MWDVVQEVGRSIVVMSKDVTSCKVTDYESQDFPCALTTENRHLSLGTERRREEVRL